MKKYLILIFILLIQKTQAQTNLYLNEFMASNLLTVQDSFGDYDDWVEIYNDGSEPVDIGGFYLTDDFSNLSKCKIPTGSPGATTIPGQSYLIIWADEESEQGVLHVDFKLSKEEERIALVEPDGETIIDSIIYKKQFSDVSFGRFPDGSENLMFFTTPTPGNTNSQGYSEFSEQPKIVESSGFYDSQLSVSIESINPDDEVYYTLDGSDPDETSFKYSFPIDIGKTTVIRARSFREGFAPSNISTKIFLINTSHTLPVLSLVTDPKNLFDDSIGIYVNYDEEGKEWEREAINQYFKNGILQYNIHSGIRIQGNSSVKMDKKSFRLFFREGYGEDRLEYQMFENSDVNCFKNLVLRAGYDEDLTTTYGTLLRDPLITELWRRLGYLTSNSNFTALYLNNDFWGIYNIRESVNENFIRDKMFYSDFDLIRYIWEDWVLKFGQSSDWEELIEFFKNNDFSSDNMIDEAANKIDIDNYTSLHALGHCTQYRSWYYGAFAFKNKQPEARWQWTIWDMDRAYTELEWNGFSYYNDFSGVYWNNIFIKKLLQNQKYRIYFINRISDLLNSLFKPDYVINIMDSLAQIIEPEIPAEAERWDSNTDKWYNNVQHLRDFISQRPDIVRQQMIDYFGLDGENQLSLDIHQGKGKIRINTIETDEFPWSGIYFQNIPINITAIPENGYRFAGWSDSSLPDTNMVTIILSDDYSLDASFEREYSSETDLIVPSQVRTDEYLPIVIRIKDEDRGIRTLVNTTLFAQSEGASSDTSFEVKKGVGSLVIPTHASSNFSLSINDGNVKIAERQIIVQENPQVNSYSGTLPDGEIIWDASSYHLITDDLTIPENTLLTIKEGAWILLKKHVNIFIDGTLSVKGTKEFPVVFSSEIREEPWGGIEINTSSVNFQYCFFLNGGGDPSKGWEHTNRQPIIFAKEESELSLDNCFILNSPGKAFGSQKSRVDISNCLTAFVFHGGEFHNTLLHYKDSYIMNIPNDDGIYHGDEDNDALHIDYIYPGSEEYSIIDNCCFLTGKDDAVDHHGSRLKVTDCWIQEWMHEGVAASGSDTVKIFNTVVKDCEQGVETGWTESGLDSEPYVFVDHCVVLNNDAGLRFGDSYSLTYKGHQKVTNTIIYQNKDNIRNYLNSTQLPYDGGIEISYSMTNDEEYDNSPYCITGIPVFDEYFYLMAGSPGTGLGVNGTNMGRVDSSAMNIGAAEITEIMYNSSNDFDTKDWIEIFNPQPNSQDISGWSLKDENDDHTFRIPIGTVLPSEGYIVICESISDFKALHPAISNIIGNFNFGYGRADQVRLFAQAGQLVDSIAYANTYPWPTEADGEGFSLELINVDADNVLAENWVHSPLKGGSPGKLNSTSSIVIDDDEYFSRSFILNQNYPNPFNSITTINYELREETRVLLKIYNLLGQEVKTLVDMYQPYGSKNIIWNGKDQYGKNVSSGIYFYSLIAGDKVKTRKMLLIQ